MVLSTLISLLGIVDKVNTSYRSYLHDKFIYDTIQVPLIWALVLFVISAIIWWKWEPPLGCKVGAIHSPIEASEAVVYYTVFGGLVGMILGCVFLIPPFSTPASFQRAIQLVVASPYLRLVVLGAAILAVNHTPESEGRTLIVKVCAAVGTALSTMCWVQIFILNSDIVFGLVLVDVISFSVMVWLLRSGFFSEGQVATAFGTLQYPPDPSAQISTLYTATTVVRGSRGSSIYTSQYVPRSAAPTGTYHVTRAIQPLGMTYTHSRPRWKSIPNVRIVLAMGSLIAVAWVLGNSNFISPSMRFVGCTNVLKEWAKFENEPAGTATEMHSYLAPLCGPHFSRVYFKDHLA